LTSLPAPVEGATSPENVEIVLRIVNSLNAREIGEALRVLADDFELDCSNSIGPLKGVYRGRDAAREVWSSLLEAWTTVYWDPVEVIDIDAARVIVVSRRQMRRRGIYEDELDAQLWTVKAGKAERLKLYRSRSEALEAAGLRE
jgi:ketosteroid isomerase-like protein